MAARHGLGTYGNAVGTVTPEDHKLAQAGLIVKDTTGKIRPGLFWEGTSTIVSGKANMSYDVARFNAALSRGVSSGAVLLANDGVVNVLTTAAPGSNSRYDVVYVWQREYSLDGTNSDPVIGVAQGTAAASPTVPSLAAFPGAIEIGRALIPAGVTATNSGTTITQTAPFTAAAGGAVTFRTKTELDLWTTATLWQDAKALDAGISYSWSGTAWVAESPFWTSYTPTLTNITLGSGGTLQGRYRIDHGVCEFEVQILLGTGGTVGTGPKITKPVDRAAVGDPYNLDHTATYLVASTMYWGHARWDTLLANTPIILHAPGNSWADVTATQPATWAANARIFLAGRYPIA